MSQQKLFAYCFYYQDIQVILVQECDIKYNFLVKGSIAYHNLNIKYKNTSGSNQDMFFMFYQNEDICYDYLQIRIDDQVIDCQIKEKQEAEEKLDQNVDQEEKKIYGIGNFEVKIGNIEQDKEFLVCFKYIELLNLQTNFYRMTLPFICSQKQIDNQNLEIQGDIYALNDQEAIVLSRFENSSNFRAYFYQIQAYHTKIKANFDDQQINLSDENREKKIYLNIQYSKNDFAMLSSYQNNSEISPYCVVFNFTPSILQAKQQMLDSIQKNTKLIKSEFILMIDRSVSISIQEKSIEMAKQSLIFFLKSLPEESIYNIISFGSNFQVMYDQSVQYCDQNVQDSIEKINFFQADMDCSAISKALEYVYLKLQDQYQLRKKVYILTDGQFSDIEQASDIAAQNRERFDINILCISQLGFENAKQLVKITGGKIQQVKESSEITSKINKFVNSKIINKVLQLLKDSFNYSIRVKIESDNNECINQIVPNPKNVCYLNLSESIRFYIYLNRKFEDVKQEDQQQQTDYIIDIKEQIPNDYHIHKMGLYQLIRLVILQQSREGSKIIDDISNAIKCSQEKVIELIKNEAVRQKILCEYTTFFGLDIRVGQDCQQFFADMEKFLHQFNLIGRECECVGKNKDICQDIILSLDETPLKKRNFQNCYGLRRNSKEKKNSSQQQIKAKKDVANQKNKSTTFESKEKDYKSFYQKVIYLQSIKGSWLLNDEIVELLNLKVDQIKSINPLSKNIPNYQNIWATIIIIHWLQAYFQENCDQHQYILLKAIGYVDKIKKQYELPNTKIPLQKLFKNYSIKKD